METSLSQQNIQDTVDLLVDRFCPAAVMLYGSMVKGCASPHSDVDLAVLLSRRTLPDAFTIAKTRTDLEALLKRDVDLVILDNISPVLAMEVIRNHRILYQTDSNAINAFAVKASGEYFDLKFSRRVVEQRLLAS